MDYRQMVAGMTPELYRRLKTAVELGKWPDGRPLDREQRKNALQAVILWDRLHSGEDQPVGAIDRGDKKADERNARDEETVTLIDQSPPRGP